MKTGFALKCNHFLNSPETPLAVNVRKPKRLSCCPLLRSISYLLVDGLVARASWRENYGGKNVDSVPEV